MPRVLVTDGEQRAALAVVRSLGRAGHEILTLATRASSLAGASRYCSEQLTAPDPLAAPDRFLAAVADAVRTQRIDIVIPISEAALLALLPARDRLAPACLPFPSVAAFRAISDKAAVLAAARAAGIATPEEQRIDHRDAPLPAALPRFPVVVKPSRSVSDAVGRRIKHGVAYAQNRTELLALLAQLPGEAYPVLLQHRITGPGLGVFLLIRKGEISAAFAHRRLREKPPSGGVSVYRESIALDAALVEQSRALLQQFHWEGVAMVEYKVDTADGRPYLMEVNGRFWGSLQLAIDAGVDFPRLLVALECGGERAEAVRDYQVGVRSRWWWGDVDHLVTRLRRSREALALPEDAPSRLAVVRDFLRLWRPGDRNETLRLSDPAPFFRETLDWVRGRST